MPDCDQTRQDCSIPLIQCPLFNANLTANSSKVAMIICGRVEYIIDYVLKDSQAADQVVHLILKPGIQPAAWTGVGQRKHLQVPSGIPISIAVRSPLSRK